MTIWNEGIIEGLCIARAFTRGQWDIAQNSGRKGRLKSLSHILVCIEDAIALERSNIAKQREKQ